MPRPSLWNRHSALFGELVRSARAMRLWSSSLFLNTCAFVEKVATLRGTCAMALIWTPGLAVRRLRLLGVALSRHCASTDETRREVSVQALSNNAGIVLLGGVAVRLLCFGDKVLVPLAK